MTERDLTLIEKVMTEGKPFQLKFSTVDNTTTVVHFTLDSDDYDVDGDGTDETTPFKNKMLWITGFRIICDAAVVLDYFNIDDKSVIDGAKEGMAADADFYADGRSKGTGANENNYPSVKDLFNLFALVCRKRLSICASTSGVGVGIDLYLYGLYTERKY